MISATPLWPFQLQASPCSGGLPAPVTIPNLMVPEWMCPYPEEDGHWLPWHEGCVAGRGKAALLEMFCMNRLPLQQMGVEVSIHPNRDNSPCGSRHSRSHQPHHFASTSPSFLSAPAKVQGIPAQQIFFIKSSSANAGGASS